MRLRSVLCASVFVATSSLACSSATDPSFGPTSSGSGSSGNGDAGSSGGSSSSGSGTPASGGQDASSGTPGSPGVPVSSDAGSTNAKDGGAVTGNDDAGSTTAPDAALPTDGFDQFQHRNLDDINMYRATLNVAPLVLDTELCTFAIAGSLELSQDHMAHQHFINASNNGTLWTSGFNMTAAENQGDPNGWTKLATDPTQNELQQIDAIQLAMFDEGPGTGEAHGHYTNMMDATSTRVGIGLLEVDGMLYLTNDFSQ